MDNKNKKQTQTITDVKTGQKTMVVMSIISAVCVGVSFLAVLVYNLLKLFK